MTVVLRVDGLTKRYGPIVAVDGVSAGIAEGELVSFVGPSGCGKTTFLRMIGGFIRPDAGCVVLDGRDVTDEPPNRRSTAMVFQSYALFPHLSVADNVGYALRVRRRARAEIAGRVEELLHLVQLEGLGARRPDQLSGGQQQRVALARALSVGPRVLLLDEPLSNLDANLRVLMREEIKRLQKDLRLTVVYVTHDQEEAMSISDRIAVLRAGRIEQIGSPTEIYERPATEFVARFLGALNLLQGEAWAMEHAAVRVQTALGWVTLREATPPPGPGARVQLVVRPEAVRLVPEGAPGATVVGKVTGAAYTGAVVRYTVDVSGTAVIVDTHDPGHAPRYVEGDRVGVRLPPAAHRLPDSGSGGATRG
jgi:putative spermidine/putrescine transport system ATP-binding protein